MKDYGVAVRESTKRTQYNSEKQKQQFKFLFQFRTLAEVSGQRIGLGEAEIHHRAAQAWSFSENLWVFRNHKVALKTPATSLFSSHDMYHESSNAYFFHSFINPVFAPVALCTQIAMTSKSSMNFKFIAGSFSFLSAASIFTHFFPLFSVTEAQKRRGSDGSTTSPTQKTQNFWHLIIFGASNTKDRKISKCCLKASNTSDPKPS